MPSTDVDGSIVVILTACEARHIFDRLIADETLNEVEQKLIRKIARDLNLEYHP